MKENNNETYNKNIQLRLWKYAKPYGHYMILSIILLLAVIGLELINPIIIGKSVDEVISKFDTVYTMVDEPNSSTIKIDNYYINKDKKTLGAKAVIVYDVKKTKPYHLAIGLNTNEVKDIQKLKSVTIKSDNNKSYIQLNNKKINVIALSHNQIKQLRSTDINKLFTYAVIFVVILATGLVLNYYQTLLLNYTGQKIIYAIRDEIFQHVESLSLQFFSKHPVGKIVTRITNDTETLNEMYTSVIANTVKSIITLIGIVIMMFVLNVSLTLYVLAIMPLIIIITFWFRKSSKKVYSEITTRVAKINTFLSEHISGMKIVQVFARESQTYKTFEKENNKLKKAYLKQLKLFSIFRPSMYLMYILGLFIILIIGANKIFQNQITIGILIIFIQYISNFFDPIQQLAEQFNIIQSAMASAEKIFILLDNKSKIKDDTNAIDLEEVKGKIEFRNVWFAYEKEEWVLRDVSFVVNEGETVAFVGATGAGKTSILSLIMRYYDIQKGEILLDDVNIKNIKISSLRKYFGQMLQDVFLFTGNIKSNIRLKNDLITDKEIVEASKYVNAHHFVKKLPNKYDEKVYEGGMTFSAGQRQLLSFARTLAFKPSILILDEATANIDTETEQLIQDALLKLMKNRTTLVVAHRLSTIQHADQIILLNKGKIREKGNHQELLERKGLYYQLYQLQF